MSGHRRALLFFHHIYSSKKRAFIRAESLALSVTGVCKVGRPGVLAVQGPDASVQEYVGKVKRLRWQSCEVNANELMDASEAAASFGPGVKEVEEMAELGREMTRAGPGWLAWWRKGMGFSI